MAKKKNAKALFEVLGRAASRADKSLGVPGWFGQPKPAAPAGADLQPTPEPQAPPSPPPPLPEPPEPAERGEPVMSISGGRLRISLNQISAVVCAAGLIALVVLAFVVGRRTALRGGRIDTADPQRGLGPTPPGRSTSTRGHVVPTPTSGPHADAEPPGMVPDTYRRKKGYSYLVIQGVIASWEDATNIKRFLYEHGINATRHLMPHTRRMYMVEDTRGFRDLRSREVHTQLAEYKAQIERLGAEYKRQGGRYDFRQPWLETER